MVILNMVIFLEIAKYGNMSYGNVFENYYHIFTLKYGDKKNQCQRRGLSMGSKGYEVGLNASKSGLLRSKTMP